jgi:phosphoglycerate dehydrogenase-like enzyme
VAGGDHEALVLETLERFSDGGPARRELLRELEFHKTLLGPVPTVDDALSKRDVHAFTEIHRVRSFLERSPRRRSIQLGIHDGFEMTQLAPTKAVCLTPSFGSTTEAAEELLRSAGIALVRVDPGDPARVEEEIREATALIVGTQVVGRELLARAGSLRVIAKHGAGVDNIDLEAAADRGVRVTYTPGANSVAVAELTMGLILSLARGIVDADIDVRAGRWSVRVGRQLAGSTLGIVGLGAVGRIVAERAAAFDMTVIYHDIVGTAGPHPSLPWERVPLAELLERADFVTIHTPLTAATTRLIDDAAVRRMRPTAFLVNTARGGIVDEDAVADAVATGRLAGAAFDVFSEEPPPTGAAVLRSPRTVVTSHMGAYTDASLASMSLTAAESIVAVLSGKTPSGEVCSPAVSSP